MDFFLNEAEVESDGFKLVFSDEEMFSSTAEDRQFIDDSGRQE